MIKAMIATTVVFFGLHTSVNTLFFTEIVTMGQGMLTSSGQILDWDVGDSASYRLTGGFLVRGTMIMKVISISGNDIWMDQDIDVSFFGKYKMQTLVDKSTGQIKELIIDGETQEPPLGEDHEVLESRETQVTVPKGTFDCIYIKSKNKTNDTIVQEWLNPYVVPVGGPLKMILPFRVGDVTFELMDFNKK